jgi:acetate kinase
MSSSTPLILVINSGSSSLKFALFSLSVRKPLASGLAERLGQPDATIRFDVDGVKNKVPLERIDHQGAVDSLMAFLKERGWFDAVAAVGHRVVNGGERFTKSELISGSDMIEEIGACPFAPLHNPAHATGMRATFHAFPDIKQVAVFDTAFHQTMKPEAFLYALPRKYYRDLAVRRYGAHGTSHRYVSGEAIRILGLDPNNSGVVVCHLGNGSSATAVHNGKCVDTSMGLTPLEGLVMGTRTGDVDYGALAYIAKKTGLDVDGLEKMVNRESGLLGLSELSNDCRTLTEAAQDGNKQAEEALDVFVHRLVRYIGALTAVMPRLDAVAFTGGIGENSAYIRAKTLKRLSALGLDLDEEANAKIYGGKTGIVSKSKKPVAIVIPTDEEWMIAEDTAELAGLVPANGK